MIFEQMQQAVQDIIFKIYELPFLVELTAGTLAAEKFNFYLAQDALYLAEFSKALALTAVRLNDTPLRQKFLRFAQEAITAEQELHLNYLHTHDEKNNLNLEPMPACFMYTNYLIKMASTASVEESVASLLPCFWVYREVGKKIAAESSAQNPYAEWITLYSSAAFSASVDEAIFTINQLSTHLSAHQQPALLAAFTRATRLEWLFWQAAYQQERWGI